MTIPPFSFCRIVFVFALLAVVSVYAGFIDSIVESGAYLVIKEAIIETGESEDYADCMVEMLKKMGSTDDVMNLKNLLPPERLVNKLQDKFKFSQIICRLGGPYIVIGIGAIIFLLTCCCCIKCCSSSKPTIIQMTAPSMPNVLIPTANGGIPYKRMEKV